MKCEGVNVQSPISQHQDTDLVSKDLIFYFYFFGVYKALDDQCVLVYHEGAKTMAYVLMFY